MKKSKKLFGLSADQGNKIGQVGLGVMHLEGRATQVNTKAAVKYFQASADQGKLVKGDISFLHFNK